MRMPGNANLHNTFAINSVVAGFNIVVISIGVIIGVHINGDVNGVDPFLKPEIEHDRKYVSSMAEYPKFL
jgi:hypothetical protein